MYISTWVWGWGILWHLHHVLTTHLISVVAVTVSSKQIMPFSPAPGRRIQVISFTIEYAHTQVSTLDDPAKGVTPETEVF